MPSFPSIVVDHPVFDRHQIAVLGTADAIAAGYRGAPVSPNTHSDRVLPLLLAVHLECRSNLWCWREACNVDEGRTGANSATDFVN